jgi:Transposase DDE domain
VLRVRDGATYSVTNRLPLSAAEVRRVYRIRAPIEEVIRVCKDQRGLTDCQARSKRAQMHQVACCFVAFGVVERERQAQQLSIDKLKQRLSFQGGSLVLPALERLRSTA